MKRSNLTKIAVASRTPHGVRGLKFTIIGNLTADPESHPSRGAWIEIHCCAQLSARQAGRTPHGVRGLKCFPPVSLLIAVSSHPSRGAWIEIRIVSSTGLYVKSHPSRGAWIEITRMRRLRTRRRSHPSRGAWIEICQRTAWSAGCRVAPLTGCVD